MGAGNEQERLARKKKKKVAKKKEAVQDRLEKAINAKFLDVEVDGKKLRLQRWSLVQGLRVSQKLAAVIKKATPLGFSVESLMVAPIGDILAEHEDDIYEILTVSVVRNNFENEAEARDWIMDLDFADALELMGYVVKLDLVPLAQKAGKLKGLVSGFPGLKKDGNAASPKE